MAGRRGFKVAQTLDNAFVFECPGIGHGASIADHCPMGMMIAFLKDPNQAPDDSCISEME